MNEESESKSNQGKKDSFDAKIRDSLKPCLRKYASAENVLKIQYGKESIHVNNGLPSIEKSDFRKNFVKDDDIKLDNKNQTPSILNIHRPVVKNRRNLHSMNLINEDQKEGRLDVEIKQSKITFGALSSVEISSLYEKSKLVWAIDNLFKHKMRLALRDVDAFRNVNFRDETSPSYKSKRKHDQVTQEPNSDLERDINKQPPTDLEKINPKLAESTKIPLDTNELLKIIVQHLQKSQTENKASWIIESPDKIPMFGKQNSSHKINRFDLPMSYCLAHEFDHTTNTKTPPPHNTVNRDDKESSVKRSLFNSGLYPHLPIYDSKMLIGSKSSSVAQITANHYKRLTESLVSSQTTVVPTANFAIFSRKDTRAVNAIHETPPIKPRSSPLTDPKDNKRGYIKQKYSDSGQSISKPASGKYEANRTPSRGSKTSILKRESTEVNNNKNVDRYVKREKMKKQQISYAQFKKILSALENSK